MCILEESLQYTTQLDMSVFAKGIYYLSLKNEKKSITKKVIIEQLFFGLNIFEELSFYYICITGNFDLILLKDQKELNFNNRQT